MPRTLDFLDLADGLTAANFDRLAPERLDELDRDRVEIRFDFDRRQQRGNARDPYRAEVSRIPQMKRAEEQSFCMALELLAMRVERARAQGGRGAAAALRRAGRDHELARNELVERNLHLVFKLLEKYRHVGVPADDLVQEANLSLFKAVENFDFRRGVLFKTYAGYWINQAFLNAIYNQSRTVRVPAYIQKAMKKLRHAASTMESGLQDVGAAAREAEVDPGLAATAVQGNRYTMSLNRAVDGADGTEMTELIEAPAADGVRPEEESEDLRQHLFEAVAQLSQREQTVLQMRYGLAGQAMSTLAEVGMRLGISLERVRQIQAGALHKIRTGFQGQTLEQYA